MLMHDCGQRPQLICEEPMATNTNGDLHWSVGPAKDSRCRRGKEGGGSGGEEVPEDPYLVCWRVVLVVLLSV